MLSKAKERFRGGSTDSKATSAAAAPATAPRKPSAVPPTKAGGNPQPATQPRQSVVPPPARPQHGSSTLKVGAPTQMEQLPTFKDTPTGERQELFIKKLELCSTVTDFAEIDNRDKELKRLNLLEIMDYINQTKGVFNEQTFPHITKMISNNLFRGLAPNNMPAHMQYDPEEDEPVLEVSWPHLQYVYEFLLRFVVSNETDPKVVKRYIDTSFLVKLLDLFDSEDPRERDYLKTILHRIYGDRVPSTTHTILEPLAARDHIILFEACVKKIPTNTPEQRKFMPYRAFIRKSINNIFYRFIYITERHNGIAELLEILGSIINGFALPLKEEHKQFLMKALLPLHKVRYVGMYHQQLSYCVTQFVEKDPKLSEQVLKTILDYWPRTYSPKEVLFLNEVEEILEMVQAEPFEALVDKLFERIALCIGSPHFQVAERALFLWNNEYIVSLIMQQRAKILPLVFGALYENSRQHWNTTVHGLTCNVVKLFMEMDGKLFDDCSADYRRETEEAEGKARKVTQMWEDIDRLAESSSLFKDPKIKEQLMPISPSLKPRTTSVLSEGDVSFDGMETKSFEELTASNKDGVRRKSMMPSNKKAES